MPKRHHKGKTPSTVVVEQGPMKKMTKEMRKQTLDMAASILAACEASLSGDAFEGHKVIYGLVEKLRNIQKGFVTPHLPRKETVPILVQWLKDNGTDMTHVEIKDFERSGYGLCAKHDISAAEPFVEVPRQLMISVDQVRRSAISWLIENHPMVKEMANVQLALFVANERASGNSFWQPYLESLPQPQEFKNALFYTPEEVLLLKGSPTFDAAINSYRSIARQYAVLFKYFQAGASSFLADKPLKYLCYEDYRWAVSVVMSRLNSVPTEDGENMMPALVPFFDFGNHCNGQVTTDFDFRKNVLVCYAQEEFKEGEQVFIFYGSRTCSDFLINFGMVYPENDNNRLAIKLGISSNDKLFAMRAEVLSRVGLKQSDVFYLANRDPPITPDLIAFVRVLVMDAGNLKQMLFSRRRRDLMSRLRMFSEVLSQELELKAMRYMRTRVSILLRNYRTTWEEDFQKYLQLAPSETKKRNAMLMRITDMKLLQLVERYIDRHIEVIKSRQDKDIFIFFANGEEEQKIGTGSDGNEDDGTQQVTVTPAVYEQAELVKADVNEIKVEEQEGTRQVSQQDGAGQVSQQEGAGQVSQQEGAGHVSQQEGAGHVTQQEGAGQGDCILQLQEKLNKDLTMTEQKLLEEERVMGKHIMSASDRAGDIYQMENADKIHNESYQEELESTAKLLETVKGMAAEIQSDL